MEPPKMQLHDWLDDLCVRFVVNLPQEELESVERICFQIEEAQWFYEDFIRPLDPTLPSLNLRQFCLLMFQHCPLFFGYDQETFIAAYSQFLAYKIRVPVRGAILLNDAMDHVVLVKGWKKGANWSFPRGKINKDEPDLDCAIREVREETGYDVFAAGLAKDGLKTKFLEVTMKGQHMKLYVFKGVPMDTIFQPQTRKEISKIQWWKLSTLPGWQKKKNETEALNANKLYMVAPFLGPLRKWISKQRRIQSKPQDLVSDAEWQTEAPVPLELSHQENAWFSQPTMWAPSQGPEPVTTLNTVPGQALASAQVPLPTEEDASDQLKRILSVGNAVAVGQHHAQQPAQQIPSGNPNAANLLSLLTSSAAGANQPHTPFERIISQKQRPESPHPTHARQADLSEYAPPPSFPIAPSQPPQNQPSQQPQGPLATNRQNLLNLLRTNPSATSMEQPHAGRALINQLSQPNAAPIEHQGPDLNVPAASQLPKPNLSSHAQNLLAAFKSNAGPPRLEGIANQPPITHELPATRADEILPHLQQWQPGHTYSRTREHLQKEFATVNPVQANNPTSPAQLPALRSPAIAQPSAVKPPTQQDSLLKLFRSPTATNVTTLAPTSPVTKLAPVPVELSAVTSPGPPVPHHPAMVQKPQDASQQIFEGAVNHMAADTSPPAPAIQAILPSRTSKPATASNQNHKSPARHSPAEFDTSDSGTVRRGKGVTTGRTLWQPDEPVPASKQQPIQILKRPGSSKAEQPLPTAPRPRPTSRPASSTTGSPRGGPNKETVPKTFQPTILKRPEQVQSSNESKAAVDALGLLADSPKPIGVGGDHKQALLSLFGGSRVTSPESNPISPPSATVKTALPSSDRIGELTSPGPEFVMSRSDTQQSTTSNADLQRSRMNSLINETRRDSGPSSRERTGSQTPMSPQDKGFLLSYLEGVVKNAGR